MTNAPDPTGAPTNGRARAWAHLLPWLVGLVGGALWLRALWPAPATTVLDRVFWYDAYYNLDAIIAQHRAWLEGIGDRDFWDWLYGGRFFHPQPRPLVVSELLPLAALVTLPLAKAPLLAHNLLLLASTVLNVVGAARFARTVGAGPLPATIAGVAFAFSAFTNFSSGRLQLVFLFPVPFALAALVRWSRDGRWRHAVAVAAWTFTAAMLCLYYALFLALVLPGLALVMRVSHVRPGATRDLLRLGVALVVAALPTAAILWPYRELRSRLGLARNLPEIVAQAGDPMMLLWADHTQPLGSLLRDVYRWDSAHFPGLFAFVGALVAVVRWLRRNRSEWKWLVLPWAVGLPFAPLIGVTPFFLGATVSLVVTVRLARAGRTSPLAPALLALLLGGFFLYLGPWPSFFGARIGPSPYALLVQYFPFVDGLRVVRRASVLMQVAMLGAAALLASRLEARRHGSIVLGAIGVLTFVEGQPLKLGVHRFATTCEDAALVHARAQGIDVVGEVYRRPPKHPELTAMRHQAELCGVSTTMGPAGFQPPLTEVVADALDSLPERWAHAWLWKLGVRHVVVRGRSELRFAERRVAELAPVTASVEAIGPDRLVALATPPAPVSTTTEPLTGKPLPVTKVTCSHNARECGRLADGEFEARWTSGGKDGGEVVTLEFAEAAVSGLSWRADRLATDLPRALRIERRDADGAWVPWDEVTVTALETLGREALHARIDVSFPPTRTDALRLTHTARSAKYWLSGTELVVYGKSPTHSAPKVSESLPSESDSETPAGH